MKRFVGATLFLGVITLLFVGTATASGWVTAAMVWGLGVLLAVILMYGLKLMVG
jgi:hypothetical protein